MAQDASSTEDESLKQLREGLKKYDLVDHIDTVPSAMRPETSPHKYKRNRVGIINFDYKVNGVANQPQTAPELKAPKDLLHYHTRPDAVIRHPAPPKSMLPTVSSRTSAPAQRNSPMQRTSPKKTSIIDKLRKQKSRFQIAEEMRQAGEARFSASRKVFGSRVEKSKAPPKQRRASLPMFHSGRENGGEFLSTTRSNRNAPTNRRTRGFSEPPEGAKGSLPARHGQNQSATANKEHP